MSNIPTWVTPPGNLGTIPEGVFYSIPLLATADNTVFYQVIAGKLPPGMQLDETGILSGNPKAKLTLSGVPLPVQHDTTSQFAVRAYTKQTIGGVTIIQGLADRCGLLLADRTFNITVSGMGVVKWTTPAGLIATYIDGTQITALPVHYTDSDIYAVNVVTVIAGSLPPGLTIDTSGVISGYIIPNTTGLGTPGYDASAYDQYPYDFSANSTDQTYNFTLRVSNGTNSDQRTFSIKVYARSSLTADNITLTADNTLITADLTNIAPPIITTPAGSIGSSRSDNYFAFQFIGLDFYGDPFVFESTTALPPGLTLDPQSGWLYGYIPFGGVLSTDYSFSIRVRLVDYPSVASQIYNYSLTITGPINSDVVWLVPNNLGTIDNGATSTLYVAAQNSTNIPLQYQLVSGSNSRLPQGLQLLPSGHIAGRVSFDTFALDGGTTTFDVGLNTVTQPTTFDLTSTFTVMASSSNGLISAKQTFSITVVRRYQEPYDNLYIQAMPPETDRALLSSLLQNPTVFPPALIYRGDDPNFGVSQRVIYDHAYGLTAATLDQYVTSLELNHYWKNLTLGPIQTAQALDDAGNVMYEVVYSKIIDNLVNNAGQSVGKQVLLSYPIDPNTDQAIDVVYPNSLQDMRDQVIDTVGQISNILPRWMLSRQTNGAILGFTPAWVIAYTVPGASGQIAYNIQTQFMSHLNLIDFEVDRYELDGFLTKNWLPADSINIANISGPLAGNVFVVNYTNQYTSRFASNQTITIANVTPSVFNSNYLVTSCTANTVQFSSDALALLSPTYVSGGQVSSAGTWSTFNSVNITAISGTGSVVTVEFDPQPLATPFSVGSIVNLAGVVPTVYNGAYTVTSCNNRSLTFNSTITATYITSGTIVSALYDGYANASPSLTRFDVAAPPLGLASWENNANAITTWEDNLNTLATWTYATPGALNQGTTFDNNSLLFTAPVDMYSSTATTEYDKYLVFPKRNILK